MNLLILPIGYLLGSIPSGYLAGKWLAGIDIREVGSGSTGATNVLRQIGKKAALSVFLIDVSKGMVAVLIAKNLLLNEYWQISIGLAALAGHIWPLWLNWQGGKAVATGLGVFLGLSWKVGLASLGIFALIFSAFKIVSIASIISAISLPILMCISFANSSFSAPYLLASLISMFLVIWRHRSNIKRLINKEESIVGKGRN